MDEKVLADHWPDYFTLGLLPLAAWLAKKFLDWYQRRRRVRLLTLRSHGRRLASIERDHVTREDFDQLTESLTSQLSLYQERTEGRLTTIDGNVLKIWQHMAGSNDR